MSRERLPNRRRQTVLEVEHGGSIFTVGVGTFPDGRPSELFVSGSKTGSELDALLNDASILASLALQYGMPLDRLCERMRGVRFERGGKTTNAEIAECDSVIDYAFRWLAEVPD